jgi:hypothetical protein
MVMTTVTFRTLYAFYIPRYEEFRNSKKCTTDDRYLENFRLLTDSIPFLAYNYMEEYSNIPIDGVSTLLW